MTLQVPTVENIRSFSTIIRIAIAFITGGNAGIQQEVAKIEQEELAGLQTRGRKLGKFEANYAPFPLPPGGFIYDCSHCQFWIGPNRCSIVGRSGDNFGGEAIHPWHYCTRWLPRRGEAVLNWVVRYLDPSTAKDTEEVIL